MSPYFLDFQKSMEMFGFQILNHYQLFQNSTSGEQFVSSIRFAHQGRNFEKVDIDWVFEIRTSPYFFENLESMETFGFKILNQYKLFKIQALVSDSYCGYASHTRIGIWKKIILNEYLNSERLSSSFLYPI